MTGFDWYMNAARELVAVFPVRYVTAYPGTKRTVTLRPLPGTLTPSRLVCVSVSVSFGQRVCRHICDLTGGEGVPQGLFPTRIALGT